MLQVVGGFGVVKGALSVVVNTSGESAVFSGIVLEVLNDSFFRLLAGKLRE